MTFRQKCAIAAMREITRSAFARRRSFPSDQEFVRTVSECAFALADAMVKAAGPEPSTYGPAPSRSSGGGE